jgi:hypothetical protein
MRTEPLDSVCPVCGTPVPFRQAERIESDMDEDWKYCERCCRTFGEARREELNTWREAR